MRIRPIFACLLAAAVVGTFGSKVRAETFLLQSGEAIEGTIVRSAGKTLSIKLPERGMRQLPISNVDHVEITLNSGELIVGELIGWSSRGYEIQVVDRLLGVKDGELIMDLAAVATPIEKVDRSKGEGGPHIAINGSQRERGAVRETEAEATDALDAIPMLTGSSAPVGEGAGDAIIRLSLSRSTTKPIAVIYSAIERAAKSGVDYRDSAGVAIIGAGKTGADIKVPIVNDDLAEPDEEFELFLSVDPLAATIEDRSIITMIRDDDS